MAADSGWRIRDVFRNTSSFLFVLKARGRIQTFSRNHWIPAFAGLVAGMTESFFGTPPTLIQEGDSRRLRNLRLEPCYNSSNPRPKKGLGIHPQTRKVRFMRKPETCFSPSFWHVFFWQSPARSLAQDDEIRWLDNYREAIQEAKRTQKPIFLEFRCEP